MKFGWYIGHVGIVVLRRIIYTLVYVCVCRFLFYQLHLRFHSIQMSLFSFCFETWLVVEHEKVYVFKTLFAVTVFFML
jgi:hypothetical protein